MADLPFIESKLRMLPPEQRSVWVEIFRYFVPNIRFGHPQGSSPDPSTNIGGGFFYGTTPAVANTEFTIAHDFGHAPYLATSVLRLDTVGAQTARLKVTRAADANYLYLSSPDVSIPITLLVEG